MMRSEWQGECLVYLAPLDKDGYGKITYRNHTERMHRAIWMEMHGPIPEDLQVCHTCDNPACWLLAHLFLGTYQENVDDKVAKGRHGGWKWSNPKTECPKGHPYNEVNTIINSRGHRVCRACLNERKEKKE